MKRVVLDASALMTFFLGRSGAERMKEILAAAAEGKRELSMSVVNWGEVYYSIWRADGREAAERKRTEIAQLPIHVVNADSGLTGLAAEIHVQCKLPYADCFAAALAKHLNAGLVTSDRDFQAVGREISVEFL